MPYKIEKNGRDKERPFKVVRLSDGKTVATSATKSNALKHIGHRVDSESKKK